MANGSSEPQIIADNNKMCKWSRDMRSLGKTIGLVPIMGYLHKGHLSLIKESHNRTNLLVVSIYINPSQFSPSEDISTYPSDFHGDILKLMSLPQRVDVVFHLRNLYGYNGTKSNCQDNSGGKECGVVSCVEERGGGHETWVRLERWEKSMCGKSRLVFFRGVATLVAKLFNIVEPNVAVFEKKDYEQLWVIRLT